MLREFQLGLPVLPFYLGVPSCPMIMRHACLSGPALSHSPSIPPVW